MNPNNNLKEAGEEQVLSRGEKIALASGKSLNTEPQYALMYLVQTGKTGALPQPYNKTDEQDLYFYADLNPETARNTGAQIKSFISDDIDSRYQLGNNRKGVAFIQKFMELPVEQVAAIAAEELDSSNFETNKATYTDKKTSQSSERKEKAYQTKKAEQFAAQQQANLDLANKRMAGGNFKPTSLTPEQKQTLLNLKTPEERKAYLAQLKTESIKLNRFISILESSTGKKVVLKENDPNVIEKIKKFIAHEDQYLNSPEGAGDDNGYIAIDSVFFDDLKQFGLTPEDVQQNIELIKTEAKKRNMDLMFSDWHKAGDKPFFDLIRKISDEISDPIAYYKSLMKESKNLNEWFGRSAYKNFVNSLKSAYSKAEALRKYDATYQEDWKGTEEAEILGLVKKIWQTFKKTQASTTPSFAADEINKISSKPIKKAA